MAILNADVKAIINETHPAWVATADKAGRPNVSAKGSFRVLDDQHVIFADIASPRTIANLTENPHVAAIIYDPTGPRGARIWGKAEIISSGELFDRVAGELAARNMRARHIVVIAVDEYVMF